MPTDTARDRWSHLVRELEVSGLPLRDFARHRGVNPSTLSWWRSQLRRDVGERVRPVDRGFAELAIVEPAGEARGDAAHLVVSLPRIAAHVRVDDTTDLGLLRAVVEALC